MMTRFRSDIQMDVNTYYIAYSCAASNSESLVQMKVSLP
jgi:hypothetical protein